MSLKLAFRPEPTLLVMEVSGQWIASDVDEVIAAARAEAERCRLRRLLVDVRQVSPPGSETTRFSAGARWAELFDAQFRAAFIVRPAMYNGFAEIVARNRGANVAVFFEEAAARKWLNEGMT